ncbi:MAG: alpha/beta hydrolase [Segniliparus sp.]|uniref:alpha/beta hydrolase n=1 Tax=Segniliparus sp. TaxID=2804064 RepID=UPI003F402F4E
MLVPLSLLERAMVPLNRALARKRVTVSCIERVVGQRPALVFSGPGYSDRHAVLYFHGGAFLSGNPQVFSKLTRWIADRLRMPVYSVDYRKLESGGVGSAVHDAVEAYRDLLRLGYTSIVVMGDSAGGFLAGKVVEASAQAQLPRPAAFVGLSPAVDLFVGRNPSRSGWRDAVLSKLKVAQLSRKVFQGPVGFVGETSLVDVPAESFPPSMFITARGELFEADIFELTARISRSGGSAVTHSFADQVHDFVFGVGFSSKAGSLPDNARYALSLVTGFVLEVAGSETGRIVASSETGGIHGRQS